LTAWLVDEFGACAGCKGFRGCARAECDVGEEVALRRVHLASSNEDEDREKGCRDLSSGAIGLDDLAEPDRSHGLDHVGDAFDHLAKADNPSLADELGRARNDGQAAAKRSHQLAGIMLDQA
jgi:hypothetical protein